MTPQIIKDCSTIFSICPSPMREFKPGIYPGNFNLDACLDITNPSRLLIDKPSNHAMHIGGKRDPVMIPTATYVLAKSVVDDFLETVLFTAPGAKPGVTWIQGDISVSQFMTVYKDEYDKIISNQRNWFKNLVRETDKEWIQSKKNVKVVTDSARYAAKYLNLEKEWNSDDIRMSSHSPCPACGVINAPSVICPNCKCVLDPVRYKSLTFAA